MVTHSQELAEEISKLTDIEIRHLRYSSGRGTELDTQPVVENLAMD